jgi:hypothetical protein
MKLRRCVVLTSILLFALAVPLLSQTLNDARDIQVRVWWDSKTDRMELLGRHYDIVYVGDQYFDIIVNQNELDQLQASKFKTEIVHQSVSAFYRSRLDSSKHMGGYRVLSEINAYVDTIVADHPTIVSKKVSIGQTLEGRDMWAIKISDNPQVDEDEPEVMYTACIHAREVITPEVILNFVDHITNNYGTDPDITALVDSREIWIVPIVNPDGYYHNQVISPGGGGMWRKNRRSNGDGSFGIDLNRNYGYEWGHDDIGSSPDGSDETYRGTGPFSELETQHLRDFALNHNFVITMYLHSASNLILWPWGYEQIYSPDQDIFANMGDSMAAWNSYEPGPIWILYTANGGTDDWHYGEQTAKPKTFAFSMEIGSSSSDGFWPPVSRIPALKAENLQPLLYLTRQAGNIYQLRAPVAPQMLVPAQVPGAAYSVAWVHHDTLNPATTYELVEMQNPGKFLDSAASLANWSTDGFTVSSTRSHSGPASFFSGSGDNLNRSLSAKESLLVEAGDTLLFWTWYDIEVDWDYAYVEVSTDGGLTYSPIQGNISSETNPHGTNRGHGITGASVSWTLGRFDLSAFIGQNIYIRFAYVTDGSQFGEGFYVDDVYPTFAYETTTIVSSSITDTFYTFTEKPSGFYYYKARAKDAQNQWGQFSGVAETFVRAGDKGDLDVDGIAYSIADLALYDLYLIQGLGVFGSHMEASIAQSDANCDGIGLTADDAVFLTHVLLGQETPCAMPESPKAGSPRSLAGSLRDNPSYRVVIQGDNLHGVDTGWVDVVLTEGNTELLGFQFHLEYPNEHLQLLDAVPGNDLAGWDYFDHYQTAGSTVNNLIVAAVAWTEGDSVDAGDISPQPTPKTLVRLRFAINSPDHELTEGIRFIWESCRDNTIAVAALPGPTLGVLALSDRVYDANLVDITGLDPLYGGAAGFCGLGYPIPDSGGVTPVAAIDFVSGALAYDPSCCIGQVGNIDKDPGELVTMSDLTVMIDNLFITLAPVPCEAEADIDMIPPVTMSDLTILIDHLFISLADLPPCP